MTWPAMQWPAWVGRVAPTGIRAAITALAASVAVAPLLDGVGAAIVALCAVVGVVVGERVDRSSVRTAPGIAGLGLGFALAAWFGHVFARSGAGADLFGLVGALRLGQWARLAGTTLALVAPLRFAAARISTLRGVEVVALAAAFVAPFAAHRGGFVARPLWLGDLAARAGVAPEAALLAVGSGAALALATLLVLDARRRVSPATWVAAPALAALVFASVDVVGVPRVEPPADLGLTRWTDGDAALPHNPGNGPGANPGGDTADEGASGGEGRAADGTPPGPPTPSGPDGSADGRSDGPGTAPSGASTDGAPPGQGRAEGAESADGAQSPSQAEGAGEGEGGSDTSDTAVDGDGAAPVPSGTASDAEGRADGTSDAEAQGDGAIREPSAPDQGMAETDGASTPAGEQPAAGATDPTSEGETDDAAPTGGEQDDANTTDADRDTASDPDDEPPSGGSSASDPPSGSDASPSDATPGERPSDAPPPPSGTPTDAPPPVDEDTPPPPDDPLEPPPELEERQGGASGAPRPMAVVVLGDDHEPPEQSWYLRQDAWTTFTGNRLVATRSYDAPRDGFDRFPVGPDEVADPPPETDRVRVRGTVSVLNEHAGPFALANPVSIAPARNPDPSRFVRSWSFESLALAVEPATLIGRVAGDATWSDAWRDEVLAGPGDPRWAELADEIVLSLPETLRDDPWAQAVAIKLWMDAEVTYSMANTRLEGPDPAGDFLFGDRVGYCVHIAHAAVFLLRARGIPSRVGTGYAVPASQRRGSVLIATAADAHAWPEVYLEGVGWVIIDIAPQQVEDAPGEPLDDAVFDRLAELARQDVTADTTSLTPPKRRWQPLRAARAVVVLLLQLLALVVAGLYVAKLWRRAAPLYARPAAVPRVAYRAALDVLVEGGLRRRFGETRMAFAERLADDVPSLPALTRAHLRDALGPRPGTTTAADARAIVALASRVRREVAAARPLRRRLVGALDPTSFLRTR